MSKLLQTAVITACLLGIATVGTAGEISGDFLEARTCDVYTGPCFANSEIGVSGLWAAAVLTIVTGVDYLMAGLRHIAATDSGPDD